MNGQVACRFFAVASRPHTRTVGRTATKRGFAVRVLATQLCAAALAGTGLFFAQTPGIEHVEVEAIPRLAALACLVIGAALWSARDVIRAMSAGLSELARMPGRSARTVWAAWLIVGFGAALTESRFATLDPGSLFLTVFVTLAASGLWAGSAQMLVVHGYLRSAIVVRRPTADDFLERIAVRIRLAGLVSIIAPFVLVIAGIVLRAERIDPHVITFCATTSILAVLSSLLLVRLLENDVVAPVLDLTDAIDRLNGGDLESMISVSSLDELGRAADSFNRLVQGLREGSRLRDHLRSFLGEPVARWAEQYDAHGGSGDNVLTESTWRNFRGGDASSITLFLRRTQRERAPAFHFRTSNHHPERRSPRLWPNGFHGYALRKG